MSHSQDYLWQIMLTLEHYHLVPQVTEEMIQQACEKLREEQWISTIEGVFIILQVFIPERCVFFDTEIDNCDEGAEVVRAHTHAAESEWIPAYVSSTVLSDRADGRWETIDFEYRGTPFHWEFNTTSAARVETNWIALFYEQLEQFFETYLQGNFFFADLGDQTAYGCYLSRQAIADLMMIGEAMEAEFGWDGFAAFVQVL